MNIVQMIPGDKGFYALLQTGKIWFYSRYHNAWEKVPAIPVCK